MNPIVKTVKKPLIVRTLTVAECEHVTAAGRGKGYAATLEF